MHKRRNLSIGVALVFFVLWALLTHSHPNSWNDTSRMATVEALVHHATWALDDTVFGQRTADRIFWNGHFYSSKPPVLSLIAAGLYAGLHTTVGISFDFAGWCDPVVAPYPCFALLGDPTPDWAYYLLTLLLVGLPSALMLGLFYHGVVSWGTSHFLAFLATGGLGLGTLIMPYSLVFSNHVPAAVGLLVGLYALLRSRQEDAHAGRWLGIAGFATALAVTFDLVTGPFLVCFAVLAFVGHRRRGGWFLAGGLLPLALLAVLDWHVLGDPLPPHMHPGGYDFVGSAFSPSVGGNRSAANVARYATRMLVGDHGLITFSPVLVWPLFGLVSVLCRRRHRLWGEAVAVGLASLGMGGYLVLSTDNFGGLGYGPRWFTAILPVMFFFATQVPFSPSWPWRSILALLTVFSLVLVWQGALAPWLPALPPHHLLRYVTSPAGHILEGLPAGTVTYTTSPPVSYLPIYPQHAWRTSLRPFQPFQGVLPVGDPDRPAVYVVGAGDQATIDRLETAFPDGRWELEDGDQAVYSVPVGAGRGRPGHILQAEFAGAFRLLGFDLPADSLQPGDTLSLRMYWQLMVPVARQYTVFVHLLAMPEGPAGDVTLWAQDDHSPGYPTYATYTWFPGEVVVDGFRFLIPAEIPLGEYVLSAGIYDSLTFQNLPRSDAEGHRVTLRHVTVGSQGD